MKRLWMCLGLFMALVGARANAQQNVETWQGTLHAGQDLRLVLQVSKSDAQVTGRLYSIDQVRAEWVQPRCPWTEAC